MITNTNACAYLKWQWLNPLILFATYLNHVPSLKVRDSVPSGQKKVSKSYEHKLKAIIRKKIAHLLDKEMPLLSKSFPKLNLTEFGKTNGFYKEEAVLTEYCKKVDIVNPPKNNLEHEKISLSGYNKLYRCIENNHPKRVRSVVRISRRSSEPQTVGSKPIGPVAILLLY